MINCIAKFKAPRRAILTILISLAISHPALSEEGEIQFNTDVLDVEDRKNIDLGQFSRKGYIVPGTYPLMLKVNGHELSEQPVTFVENKAAKSGSQACITAEMIPLLGLKPEYAENLSWDEDNQCLNFDSLPGMEAEGDIASDTLNISLPQAYVEYVSDSWDPPARWDEGINGVFADYYANAQTIRQSESGRNEQSITTNGVVGANFESWRLRADWQSRTEHSTGSSEPTRNTWDWSRVYAYRAIPRLGAKLTLGEDFFYSDIFSSFRFTGASLRTDDNMLPPNLRGYAPEITGIARTNARVTISQLGRVLYETQVPAGPFQIQDLSEAVTGTLDVRVEEQDGTVQAFSVDTSSIPYLTRPGLVRYKLASGKPSESGHETDGPLFTSGEFSWGVSNGWSLYGGAIGSGDYQSMAVGVGRDLLMFGAVSFDVTRSRALLPQGTLQGNSYRMSYSKRFDEISSQVTFAGYRFSERDYLTMGEFLNARRTGEAIANSKELYTVTFNKQFRDAGLSLYGTYSHQTYWDRPENDRYNLALSKITDIGSFKNVSMSLSAYRTLFEGTKDDGIYLSLSIPWGTNSTVSYSASRTQGETSQQVGYYGRRDNGDFYQVTTGASQSGANVGGYYTHMADAARINVNGSVDNNRYTAAGLSVQGGATLTAEGGALHRVGVQGGTRLLVDTSGVPDVPVKNYGTPVYSNHFGKAVIADVNSYYRNTVQIDLDKIGNDAEAHRSVVQATLTEGAIGYRKFDVIAGAKVMAVIRLADGSFPPFGAAIVNSRQQKVGLVGDSGLTYLTGAQPGHNMAVEWGDKQTCEISIPENIAPGFDSTLLLPCQTKTK